MTKVIIFLAVVWAIISFWGRAEFDARCVTGRISQQQANVLNKELWAKCPKYNNGQCTAEGGDRIIKRECSEFFAWLWRPWDN